MIRRRASCWMRDVTSMQSCRTGEGVVVYDNRIYAQGSNVGKNDFTLPVCEEYNSATNSWTILQSLSKPVTDEGTLVSKRSYLAMFLVLT